MFVAWPKAFIERIDIALRLNRLRIFSLDCSFTIHCKLMLITFIRVFWYPPIYWFVQHPSVEVGLLLCFKYLTSSQIYYALCILPIWSGYIASSKPMDCYLAFWTLLVSRRACLA